MYMHAHMHMRTYMHIHMCAQAAAVQYALRTTAEHFSTLDLLADLESRCETAWHRLGSFGDRFAYFRCLGPFGII